MSSQEAPSYILQQREKILAQAVDPDVINKSLITDRNLKRKNYACKDAFVTVDKIPVWNPTEHNAEITDLDTKELLKKISVWGGDITRLEIDAIVNAANEGLLGGGGIDEAIHGAAGPLLQRECANLPLCYTGNAVITKGYMLPATWVIHTVGPYLDDNNQPQPELLKNCYTNTLKLVLEYNIRTIAIPSISTGFYGYPKEDAARIAVTEVVKFLKEHSHRVDRIIFNLYKKQYAEPYHQALKELFVNKPQ